ncbi:MAG: hypothetical protein RJA07_1702 [Bacteroidota bacterium]|jgi:hypothetical protein
MRLRNILLLILLLPFIGKAQTPVGLLNTDDLDSLSNHQKRFSPSLYFGVNYYPERHLMSAYNQKRNISDTSFQYSRYEFSTTVPLIRWQKPEGSHQINAFISGSWNDFVMDSIFQHVHSLYSANVGLQYMYYQPKENLLLFHITVGFANDQYYLNEEIGLRYSTLLLYYRLKNPKFQYFVGMATTTAFNLTQYVPLVGAKIKITPKDFVRISFPLRDKIEYYPVRFAYYHPLSKRTMVFGQIENTGNTYRLYSANEEINANTASILFRESGRTVGLGVRYLLKNNIRFQFEINNYYRNNQVVSISDRDADITKDKPLYQTRVQSGLLLQGSLVWNINKAASKSKSPRVDYLDIQNIDVEDLPDDLQ